MVKAEVKTKAKSGGDSNIMGVVAYLFWPLSSIILYLIKKDDSFVKFHAVQSLLLGIVVFVLFVVYMIGSTVLGFVTMGFSMLLTLPLMMLLSLAVMVYWLFVMWKTFQGETYKVPFIGGFAEQYSK